ncbi:MAG: protein kinase [Acidobacteriota bacterium]
MSLLGTSVGRIRLVDHLGKGGMGDVYVGYDETLDRRVAVKCVRVGSKRSEKMKGRFLQEARILSRLAHPNICQIYDYVEDGPRDFLVMELVEGRSLEVAVDEGLDHRAKLRIAQRVADVLVAAHAEGVVHRDLKPEHVMITEDNEVKVLDFGIAHSVGGEHDTTIDFSSPLRPLAPLYHTRAGSVVGTPRYMSPEQARGEPVTPASDMYTFGLLLQELFTGEKPYDKAPLEDLLKVVAEGRSRAVNGLGTGLTQLIEGLKQMKPGDRPSAKETADRIKWIREAPVRWLRRGLAAAALLVVIFGVTKYALDLRRERMAAVAARNQAEGLVTFMLEDLSRELRPVGRLALLEQVARQALDYYDQTAPDAAGEPKFTRGRAYYSVADVLEDQGDTDAALEAATQAMELHQQLVDQNPERAEWRQGLALDHMQLGSLQRQRGEREAARASLATARRIAADLIDQEPDNQEWQRTYAEASYALGMFHLFYDWDPAIESFNEAIAVYQKLAELDPEQPEFRYRQAVLYGQGLGQAFEGKGQFDESFAAVRKSHDLYRELTELDPSNTRWQYGFSWEHRRLGQHQERVGDIDGALASYRRAMAISQQLLKLEPLNFDWQLGLAADHGAIAAIHRERGNLESALAERRKSLAISQQLSSAEPQQTTYLFWLAEDYLHLGSVLAALGRADEAREAWSETVRLGASHVTRPADVDGYGLQAHALALIYLDRIDQARPLVAFLVRDGWFEGSASEELIEACQRHQLLPAA